MSAFALNGRRTAWSFADHPGRKAARRLKLGAFDCWRDRRPCRIALSPAYRVGRARSWGRSPCLPQEIGTTCGPGRLQVLGQQYEPMATPVKQRLPEAGPSEIRRPVLGDDQTSPCPCRAPQTWRGSRREWTLSCRVRLLVHPGAPLDPLAAILGALCAGLMPSPDHARAHRATCVD